MLPEANTHDGGDDDVNFSQGSATVRSLLPAFPALPGMAGHISFREATR